jgi:hypothetical protein
MPELCAARGKRDLVFRKREYEMGAQNLGDSYPQTVAVPAASIVAAHPSMVRAYRAYPWRARDPPPGAGVGEEEVIAQVAHVKQK